MIGRIPENKYSLLKYLIPLILGESVSGCAIHYFDAGTGTEHVWGIGHIALQANSAGSDRLAFGYRVDTVGFALGSLRDEKYLGFGWNSHQHLEIVDPASSLCIGSPDGSLYNWRVGSSAPTKQHCGL